VTSSYLKNTRSPEELDALIEEHTKRASTNEKKFIEKDIPETISNIDSVCKDSVSMLEEKTTQIISKISTWVATATAEIFNDTEAARIKITNIVEDPFDPRPSEIINGMITQVSNLSINLISQSAETSIRKIRLEASQSIQDLRKNAANAFKNFRAIAARLGTKIRESIVNTGNALEAVKKSSNGQQLLDQVRKETEKAVADAESASDKLEKAKARTINRINEALEIANQRIEQAHADATKEIQESLEKAVSKLKLTTEAAQALYPLRPTVN